MNPSADNPVIPPGTTNPPIVLQAGLGLRDDSLLLRRNDPEHVGLLSDMRDVKTELLELKASSHRTERYLVGGWADDGVTWVIGIRERVASVERMKTGFWVLVTGVWAIALAFITAVANHLIGIYK